jgi:solute carrier family 13 (sodium-dependent dicarboxylate transporter), member 2/3/5
MAASLLFVLPIDWGTILLFGAGIALGPLMREAGLTKSIGGGAGQRPERLQPGVDHHLRRRPGRCGDPALAAIFGANYGFMLPLSTPPNAIVYSSGMLPITRMVKTGAVFDVIGAILCVVGVALMANAVMANVVGLA